MKIVSVNTFLFLLLGVAFSDAKGIKVGGIKVPKVPKPKVPVIVPVVVPVPVGTGRLTNDGRNNRLHCYECEGSDNSLCSLNPAGINNRQVRCPERHYCSTIRREVILDSKTSVINPINGTSNETKNFSVIDVVNSTMSTVESLNSSTISPVDIAISSSPAPIVETNSTLYNSGSERSTRVTIQRGCKSVDFLEGMLLSSRTTNDTDASEKVYAQLCSTKLCNTGDGRLMCYACSGVGQSHSCMISPSSGANVITCQPNESCFVERRTSISNSTSGNSTETIVSVSRGCRVSSFRQDSQVITSNGGNTLTMSCRLNNFCNSYDASRLVRSTAFGRTSSTLITILTVFIVFMLK